AGRGGGTSLPGKVLTRVEPHAIGRLARRLDRGSVVISATNGKTTTAAMAASILAEDGTRLVHNRAGANMAGGIASALAGASRRGGRALDGDFGLFEVDEFWLGAVVEELEPRAMLLGNLFRDQLDRYGELETIADRWAAIVTQRAGLVLNADDPLVADLGRDTELARRHGVTYFGIEDEGQAIPELQHAFDAKHCRRCGSPYSYARAFVGHLGHYSCPNCGADRPDPDVAATRIELEGMSGSRVWVRTPQGDLEFRLPLPGLYNVYNALAALTAAMGLGIAPGEAARAMASMEAVFGRVETLRMEGRDLSILLIKNPAGANEVLRTLLLETGNGEPALDVWVALNDRIADGRDISWVWDADFELLAGRVRRVTCAGTRAPEMAVRLKYAGVAPDVIDVDGDIAHSIDLAVERANDRLFALPTYTALLELRTLLAKRGLARDYWA
ncbi:MAG: MurT ligase domain-containing protein, partial [Solirubrobacterales bacterium]